MNSHDVFRILFDAFEISNEFFKDVGREIFRLKNGFHAVQHRLIGNLGCIRNLAGLPEVRKPWQKRLTQMFAQFASQVFGLVETFDERKVFRIVVHQWEPFATVDGEFRIVKTRMQIS